MKNQREKTQAWTAENIDPHGIMKNIRKARRALSFVGDRTGTTFDETPVDLKADKAVNDAAPGDYVLIARTPRGGHMVYAKKTGVRSGRDL